MGALSPAIATVQALWATARDWDLMAPFANGGCVGANVAPARGNRVVGSASLDQVDRVLAATHLAAARCTEQPYDTASAPAASH